MVVGGCTGQRAGASYELVNCKTSICILQTVTLVVSVRAVEQVACVSGGIASDCTI